MTTIEARNSMNYDAQKTLVTGGAGFIGSHLVERLLEEGACVTVVDDLSTGNMENLAAVQDRIQFIEGDLGELLKAKTVQPISFDYIFHLAGNSYVPWSVKDPAKDFASNLMNTFLLLEAMRETPKPPRLVNVSSAAVYGDPVGFPIGEGDPTVPISPYGVSKLAAERYVDVYSRIYGLPAASVRLFSVYGPRQRKQVVYDLLQRLRFDPTRLEVLGDGTQARDFIHVDDVTSALLIVGRRAPCGGEVYNVASGTTCTISWLVKVIYEECNEKPRIVYGGDVRPGDAQIWEVDIGSVRSLGFESMIGLRGGVGHLVEWYDGQSI